MQLTFALLCLSRSRTFRIFSNKSFRVRFCGLGFEFKKNSSVHSCMVKLSSGDNKSNSLWILCVLLKREEKESFVRWHNAILSLNSSNLQTKYFVNCGNLVITWRLNKMGHLRTER